MKIAHVSDLHLGRKSVGDPNGAERLTSWRHAITRLAAEAPEAILIAGDIFDSLQVEKAVIQETARTLTKAKDPNGNRIPVVLIAGNHDPSDAQELWGTFQAALDSSIHLVLAPKVISLHDGKLLVEAYPCETRYSPEAPWTRRLPQSSEAGEAIRVVLAHGTLQGGQVPEGEIEAYPFTKTDAESLAADYVALGHFHGIYPPWEGAEAVQRSICYSGAHEPDQFSGDSGWAILADLEHGRPAKLRRLRIGRRRWRLLEIAGPLDLARLEELRAEIESDPEPGHFVVRVKIHGKTQLTPQEAERLENLEANLRALGAHLERQGESQILIQADTLDLNALPAGALKQALLSLQSEMLQEKDPQQREILEAAVQWGWLRIQP